MPYSEIPVQPIFDFINAHFDLFVILEVILLLIGLIMWIVDKKRKDSTKRAAAGFEADQRTDNEPPKY